jgi:hypothetical protein
MVNLSGKRVKAKTFLREVRHLGEQVRAGRGEPHVGRRTRVFRKKNKAAMRSLIA